MQNRVKEFRVKMGITQSQLADLVGVRRETIIYLEMGKYMPSLKLAFETAKALNVEINDLFIFEEEKL